MGFITDSHMRGTKTDQGISIIASMVSASKESPGPIDDAHSSTVLNTRLTDIIN